MDETCDRCGPPVRAAYRLTRGMAELFLCLPCAPRNWRALTAQGWTFWLADTLAVAPQAQAG